MGGEDYSGRVLSVHHTEKNLGGAVLCRDHDEFNSLSAFSRSVSTLARETSFSNSGPFTLRFCGSALGHECTNSRYAVDFIQRDCEETHLLHLGV